MLFKYGFSAFGMQKKIIFFDMFILDNLHVLLRIKFLILYFNGIGRSDKWLDWIGYGLTKNDLDYNPHK